MKTILERKGSIRVLAALCCIALIVSFLPVQPAYAYTVKELGDQPYVEEAEEGALGGATYLMGKEVPVKKVYQDMIDYYLIKDGPVYKGSGQCYGYAEMMRKRFGSGSGKKVTVNKNASAKNMYKYLKDVKPGTHVRFQYPGGNMNHSICVFKVTKDYIYCSEGNADGGGNGIACGAYSIGSFDGMKFQYYIEPTGGYKKKSTSPKAHSFNLKNRLEIVWEPISGVSKYTIYRSYSKSSGYKKIGTSTHPRFVDKTAKFGVVYYKVKAGSYKTSAAKVYHKLLSVDVTVSHNSKGYAVLTWPKVEGANKYVIYKGKYLTDYNHDYVTIKKLKAVTGTKYTYLYTGSYDYNLWVRPIYSKNTKCNGNGTYVYGPERVAPKSKVVDATLKKAKDISYYFNDEPVYYEYYYGKVGVKPLCVNKHATYLYIQLYRSTTKNGDYSYVGDTYVYNDNDSSAPKKSKYTSTKVYYVKDESVVPGQTYYYRALAINSNGRSLIGEAKKITYPSVEG